MVGVHANSITDRSLQKNQLGPGHIEKTSAGSSVFWTLCGSSLKVWSWAGLDAGILSIESSQRSQPRRAVAAVQNSNRASGQILLCCHYLHGTSKPWLVLEPSERCTRHPSSKGFLSALPGHSSTNTIADSGCQRIWVRPKTSLPNYPKLTLKIS